MTIPIELRSRLGIEEGSLLEVEEERGAIVMRPTGRLKSGKVVGAKEYRRVINELEELRRNWR